jgi:hypothetical protein
MSSSSSSNINNNSGLATNVVCNNNPASALVASARPPIPLAPRLTTTSTSQQSYSVHSVASPLTGPSKSLMSSPEHSSSATSAFRPRHLIHRASQSVATQALNFDTSPPVTRLSAYVPHPSRMRPYGSLGRTGGAFRKSTVHTTFGLDEPGSTYNKTKNGRRDTVNYEGESASAKFEVLPQFRSDADFPGEVLVRCSGSDFYVHRA